MERTPDTEIHGHFLKLPLRVRVVIREPYIFTGASALEMRQKLKRDEESKLHARDLQNDQFGMNVG